MDSNIRCVRAPHNKENPYFLTSRETAQDMRMTACARGLLWYILSLPSDWISNPSHLAKVNKFGKDKIYKVIKELMVFGYCDRKTERDLKGRHISTTYVFYEVKQKWLEDLNCKKSPLPENPEAVLNPENPLPEKPDPDKPDPENKDITEYIENSSSKNNNIDSITSSLKVSAVEMLAEPETVSKSSQSTFPKEVQDMAGSMIEILKSEKPTYRRPDSLLGIMSSLDLLIRKDKRNPQNVLDVFRWAVTDSFWADKMFKPNPAKYLREKFDQLEMKMNAKPDKKPRGFLPSSNQKEARRMWDEMDAKAVQVCN